MARLARLVIPGIVHHVTHRGNRRGDIFLDPWLEWLSLEDASDEANAVRLRQRTSKGRPCGDPHRIREVEQRLRRLLLE